MDKFTRESLEDMMEILKDLNPKKCVDTDKKIELLEKRLKKTPPDWVAEDE